MKQNIVKLVRLTDQAFSPTQATPGSTGYDLRASEAVTLKLGYPTLVSTGLKLDGTNLDPMIDIQVRSRSGLAAKESIFVLNSPGTIDADYQGEIKVILMNLGDKDYEVQAGDRIAQLVFGVKANPMVFVTDKPSDAVKTERGGGGFGSSGR